MKYSKKPSQQTNTEKSQRPFSQQDNTDSTYGLQTEKASADEVTAQVTNTAETSENEAVMNTGSSEPDASVPNISEQKVNEITQKLKEVSGLSGDLVGWIYIADSDIDYPVVQGTDNHYYLDHAPDGSDNQLGSIFLSYQCSADLSDSLNILYGHNMQSGMFGDIRKFKEQEQFEAHRYGWLFTTESLYRIDFFTLSIVSAYDTIYDIPSDRTEWMETLKSGSLHYRELEINDDDKVAVLSTCSSDFEDARALFAGKLTWIQEININ